MMLIGGVALTGGGAVLAAAGGSSSHQSAAKTQYCKDGTVQQPGKKCKPKKPKKTKITVHAGHKRCYTGTFTLRVRVTNKPSGRSTRVYRDGILIRSTRRNRFTVHVDTSGLSSGRHTIKIRVRGSNGKFVTRTVRFRRC
jgi:hypothetical protein